MSKYGAKRTQVDGVWFDSKREAARYSELDLLQKAGIIRNLVLQPQFPIVINGQQVKGRGGHKLKYIADFAYIDTETGERHVEDVKGRQTPVSSLKIALVEAIHGVRVEIVK